MMKDVSLFIVILSSYQSNTEEILSASDAHFRSLNDLCNLHKKTDSDFIPSIPIQPSLFILQSLHLLSFCLKSELESRQKTPRSLIKFPLKLFRCASSLVLSSIFRSFLPLDKTLFALNSNEIIPGESGGKIRPIKSTSSVNYNIELSSKVREGAQFAVKSSNSNHSHII